MPTLRIKRPDNDTLVVCLGEVEVGYAQIDQHGWNGMEAVEDMAREIAKHMRWEVQG